MKLPHRQFSKARDFIFAQGRELERQRFSFEFERASVNSVLSVLAKAQNADGGFGHGLEPDVQSVVSSVLATTIAFQVLTSLDCSAEEPLVQKGLSFLEKTFDATNGVWPIVPPEVVQSPHAPWWDGADHPESFAPKWNGFRHNPRAEIIGYFLTWRTAVDPGFFRDALQAFGWPNPDPGEKLDMHELQCWIRLVQSPSIESDVRQELIARLSALVSTGISRDPSTWKGYCLKPLDVVKSPDSPFASVIGQDAMHANLDWLIARQADDGAWHPTWNWGGKYPEAWIKSERAWSGVLTLDALRVLKAFGRI